MLHRSIDPNHLVMLPRIVPDHLTMLPRSIVSDHLALHSGEPAW
jgi:hypothetical protein